MKLYLLIPLVAFSLSGLQAGNFDQIRARSNSDTGITLHNIQPGDLIHMFQDDHLNLQPSRNNFELYPIRHKRIGAQDNYDPSTKKTYPKKGRAGNEVTIDNSMDIKKGSASHYKNLFWYEGKIVYA